MWYCFFNGEKTGPLSRESARMFINEHPGCLVWREGMAEWMTPENAGFDETALSDTPPKGVLHPKLSFEINGDDMQYIEFDLKPRETVLAEPGSMIYKQYGIDVDASFGAKQHKSLLSNLWSAGKRVLSGENLFFTSFTNVRNQNQKVAFSAPYPGKIIPVSLSDFGGQIICQKDSFLCAEPDTEISIFFQKRIMTAIFGGAGFIMQSLHGNGTAFIHAGGAIHEYNLSQGESMQVDAGCLVAFEPSVMFDITNAGSLKSQIFGGAGLFFANLSGPGRVWVQSLPFTRFASRLTSVREKGGRIR